MKSSVRLLFTLFGLLSRTFAAVPNHEEGEWSSDDSDSKIFSTTLDEGELGQTVVKFRLNGVPEENQNIQPNNISLFLATHSCKQESLAGVSITSEGRVEILIDYKCHESVSNGLCSRVAVILLVIGFFICTFFIALRARTASRVNGEVRWRMWSVPQLRFATAIGRIRSDSRSQSDMTYPNEKLFTDDTISAVLSHTMLKPFGHSEKV